MSNQSLIIDKKVFEFDITQVFYCFSVLNIIRNLTSCEIYNKNEKVSEHEFLKNNMYFGINLNEKVKIYHKVLEIKDEPNFKLLKFKVKLFNNILLSNEYKYNLIQKFYKDIEGKTINLIEIETNRKYINLDIIKNCFKNNTVIIQNYLNFHIKNFLFESIMINKEMNIIYNYIKDTNLFKKYKIKKIKKNEEELEIFFKKKDNFKKISLIKISDYHSFIQIRELNNNVINYKDYLENKNLLKYFLKRLKNIVEKKELTNKKCKM